MERVLGKKQSIRNEDWLKAVKRIEELVSREELDEKQHTHGPPGKTALCSEKYAAEREL